MMRESQHGRCRSVVHSPERLEEEIRYMEARLDEIGFEGDCAYERAMSRFFSEQIAARRQQLAGMESSGART
jgi:hypothetical protein